MLDATGTIDAGMAAARLNDADLAGKKLKTAVHKKQKTAEAAADGDSKGIKTAGAKTEDAKLQEACEGFEAVFLQKMWQDMRKSVPKEGFLHSREEEQWLSMFDQEMASKLAKDGGIGIKNMLYDQLKDRLQTASRELPSQVRDPLPIMSLDAASSRIKGLAGTGPATEVTASSGVDPAWVKLAGADRQGPPVTAAGQSDGRLAGDVTAQVNALAVRIEAEQSARQRSTTVTKPIVNASLDRTRRR